MKLREKINFNLLYKKIKQNPWGFTLNIFNLKAPAEGFALSPYKDKELKIKKLNKKVLKNYILKNFNYLIRRGHFLGGWYNDNDKMFYLDISIVVKNLQKALKLAQENKQIAIYDIKEKKEIRV